MPKMNNNRVSGSFNTKWSSNMTPKSLTAIHQLSGIWRRCSVRNSSPEPVWRLYRRATDCAIGPRRKPFLSASSKLLSDTPLGLWDTENMSFFIIDDAALAMAHDTARHAQHVKKSQQKECVFPKTLLRWSKLLIFARNPHGIGGGRHSL